MSTTHGFSQTTYDELAQIAARYPQGRSGLLPMLHLVQSTEGRITPEGIEACADILGISAAEVSGVATFYTMYKRKPVGDYHVGVCTNTLCAVMGGDAIFERLKDHLDVGNDETTADGKVTLEHLECNAACDYAPVMMVNWEFMDNMTPQSATELVDDLREGERPRPCPACGVPYAAQEDDAVCPVCLLRLAMQPEATVEDDLADEGPPAGPASLAGLQIARERGWNAPSSAASGPTGTPGGESGRGAAAEADTSRAESETKVADSPADVSHQDDAKGDDE